MTPVNHAAKRRAFNSGEYLSPEPEQTAIAERPVFDLDAANRIRLQIERAKGMQEIVDAAKQAEDFTEHWEAYGKLYEDGWQQVRLGYELMIEAMYKGGRLLNTMPKNPGNRYGTSGQYAPGEVPPTLPELGFNSRKADEWRVVGRLDESTFETWLAQQNNKDRVSKSELVRFARKKLGLEQGQSSAPESEPKQHREPEHPLTTLVNVTGEMIQQAEDDGLIDALEITPDWANANLTKVEAIARTWSRLSQLTRDQATQRPSAKKGMF